MMRNTCIAVAAFGGCLPLAPAFAQGAIKPVEALVVNPSTRPVPVTVLSAPAQAGEGSHELYSLRAFFTFQGNTTACTDPFTLPSGKRLVLTHLAGIASLPAPAALTYVAVAPLEAGQPTGSPVIAIPAAAPLPLGGASTAFNQSVAGQQVHAHIDGGFQLCIGSSAQTQNGVSVKLAGYLVNKP